MNTSKMPSAKEKIGLQRSSHPTCCPEEQYFSTHKEEAFTVKGLVKETARKKTVENYIKNPCKMSNSVTIKLLLKNGGRTLKKKQHLKV